MQPTKEQAERYWQYLREHPEFDHRLDAVVANPMRVDLAMQNMREIEERVIPFMLGPRN